MAGIDQYRIYGDDLQMVELVLAPGAGVRAQAGAMLFMEEGIEMETSSGGMFKGLKRMLTGESFFIPSFWNRTRESARLGFAGPHPGKIVPLALDNLGGSFLCQRTAFLCAEEGVEIDVAFTRKLGAGMFGGEGFILQRLQGNGLAFIHAGGTIIERELGPRENLRVETGSLVAFAPSVDYDIRFVGGFKNTLFGGEGLFLTSLTGPGLVYLQTLPFSRLADRIVTAAGISRKKD